MKKCFVAVILCTIFAMLFSACVSTDGASSNQAQIPNPITDCKTMEEAKALAGFDMAVPETVDGYEEKQISVIDDKLIQVRFTHGAQELLLRKCRGNADCSGDYNEYAQVTEEEGNGVTVTMKGANDRVKLAVWTDGEYSYSIGAYGGEGMPAEEMTALAQQVQ